ncbi:sulfatase-like hydrolase/transferase [Bacteroidota bacterium]
MKKTFRTISWHCLLLILVFCCGPKDIKKEHITRTDKPNIVLILSDDQAWTDYGFMGHQVVKTPNLDRLAKESILFPHGYVTTAVCRPSLMTLSTGLFPHQHKITGNDPAGGFENPEYPREDLLTNIDKIPALPRILAQHGYLS